MIVIEKNVGPKIDYILKSKKLCFNDDLTINLVKREEDWPVHIDVCFDEDKTLVIGAAAGRSYVAEIDIPARQYIEVPPAEEGDDPTVEPVPLDTDTVTLTLWAIE